MPKIKLDHQTAELFERLMRQNYIVEDGKNTRSLVKALRGNVPFYSGRDYTAKKIIVVIPRTPRYIQRRKTLRNTFFKIYSSL